MAATMFSVFVLGILASTAKALLLSPATGPYAVSYQTQVLTDSDRLDPYAPSKKQHARQIMISVFLPVDETKMPCTSQTVVPYMTPMVADGFDRFGVAIGLPKGSFPSFELDFCSHEPSSDHANSTRKFPVALFSPGWGYPRHLYGTMAREIASHGYAVITVDHSYDAVFVELPDGTVYPSVDFDKHSPTAMSQLLKVRAGDMSFVLSHLYEKPVAEIDPEQAIVIGHSLGGTTASNTVRLDPRFLGGINIDGELFEPIKSDGLSRPFALVGTKGHEIQDPSWNVFYDASKGQRSQLAVDKTAHGSFTDFPILIKSLNVTLPKGVMDFVVDKIGTLEFGRSNQIIAGVVAAFTDLVTEGRVDSVLKGDKKFPEVSAVRGDL